MNEWEWRLLEDKAPAGTLTIAGVEVKPGDILFELDDRATEIATVLAASDPEVIRAALESARIARGAR